MSCWKCGAEGHSGFACSSEDDARSSVAREQCHPSLRRDLLYSECSEIPGVGRAHKGERMHPCTHCHKILGECARCRALFVQRFPYGHPCQFTTCEACRCDAIGEPTDNLDIVRRVLEHEKKSEN